MAAEKETTEVTVVEAKDLEAVKESGKYSLVKSGIEEKQILKMMQRTPAEHVFTRAGKGGGTFDYVTGVYVQKVLNFVFGWNWDFEVVSHERFADQVIVQGKLTVRAANGQAIVKTQFGRADIKYKKDTKIHLDIGNDYKAASTDALKKCASQLGIASDIYGKNEFKDIGKKVVDKKPKETAPARTASKAEATVLKCSNCGEGIDKAVDTFSRKMYRKSLCRDCQKIAKKK